MAKDDDKIKSSTTTSLPFGFGEKMHAREDSEGNRGVGWTPERAQKSLKRDQEKNKK